MKRILCLIDGLTSGGAQRQLVGLSVLLKKAGYQVSFMWYHDTNFYEFILKENKVNCINIIAGSKISKISCVRRTIKRLQPDVVISYLDSPCVITCILKLLGGHFKLIVSERNTSQTVCWRERIKFNIYRYADFIVPNSFSQCNYIKQNFPFLSNKIITITNFVDTDYFSPALNRSSREFVNILSVGRIGPQKNVMNYIRAIKLLKARCYNFKILWYGSSYNADYYQSCLDLIRENQLEDVFFFMGQTKDILNAYRDADVFCLPSIFEGFPNVICEAMSCGLPILCSNICDNPQIIDNGKNGFLFNPHSETSIVDALCSFLKMNEKDKQSFSNKSREMAKSRFAKDIFLKSYIDIIEN